MPGRLEQVVEYRLSHLDGDYSLFSCDDGESYFEVGIGWEDGSEVPRVYQLAGDLLPIYGFGEGVLVSGREEEKNELYIRCVEGYLSEFERNKRWAPELKRN